MPIIEEDVTPHSDENSESSTLPEVEQNELSANEAFKAFGLDEETEVKKEVPPTEQPKTNEKKGITVKFNKEETFIEEDKVPELARKGLNYDKVEGRVKELQDSLDRAAKLSGYKDHAAYVADFDNIEKQQQQNEQNAHNQLLADLREQAEDAGLDADKVESYLKNHPLVKEAEKLKQEREIENEEKKNQGALQENITKWQAMYKDPRVLAAFPNIVKDSEAFENNEMPSFFTAEMQARVNRGYDPLDAILLAHADKFQGQSKRATEQRLIKEQQLGLRSRVETNTAPDNEPQVSPELASAFAAFDLPAESAKKYSKAR